MQKRRQTISERWARFVRLTVALSVFAYVAYRAATLSFVHDESFSYLVYASPGIPLGNVLHYIGSSPSNNHLLNTLLMRGSAALFGPGEFSLRLPNVLSFILYLIAVYKVTNRFQRHLLRVGVFAAAVANPFLLDFFGLARGYGIALAFAALSLLLLVRYNEDSSSSAWKFPVWATIFSGLAMLANFTFLTFHITALAIAVLFALRWFFSESREGAAPYKPQIRAFVRHVMVPLLASGFTLLIAVPILLKLRSIGELYIGGTTGFFSDTVRSLIRSSLYLASEHTQLETFCGVLGLILVCVGIFYLFRHLVQAVPVSDSQEVSVPDVYLGTVATLTLLLMTLGIVLLNVMWDVKFPTDRSALMFWFPLTLAVGFSIDQCIKQGSWIALSGRALGVFLIAATVVSFVWSANLTHTLVWRYDADTKAAMKTLTLFLQDTDTTPPRSVGERTLGISPSFEPSVNYYIYTRDLWFLAFVDRSGVVSRPFDYYFYAPEDQRNLAMVPLKKIDEFPTTGNILAKRTTSGIVP